MALEMQSEKRNTSPTTQGFLRLSEIRDSMVIMQDGTLRAVLAVSSTNFDLKNEDEQNALVYNYQRFLNSLDFPVQILMQSRKLDIGDYVEKLKRVSARQTNELLKVQTEAYTEFISKLIENANVMSKSFYIVIPYAVSINPATPGFMAKLFKSSTADQVSSKIGNLRKYSELLDQRVNSASSEISSLGLKAIRLNTEQLVELYYNSYNFESAPILDASKLTEIKVVEE